MSRTNGSIRWTHSNYSISIWGKNLVRQDISAQRQSGADRRGGFLCGAEDFRRDGRHQFLSLRAELWRIRHNRFHNKYL
jgi:hypothetical protein